MPREMDGEASLCTCNWYFPACTQWLRRHQRKAYWDLLTLKKIHYWMWMLRVLFEDTPQFLLGDGAAAHRLPWGWYVTLNMIKIFVECHRWFSYDEIEFVCWILDVIEMLVELDWFSMCWMWMSAMFMLNVMYDLKNDRDVCWIWFIFMSWMRMWSLNVIVILACDQILHHLAFHSM